MNIRKAFLVSVAAVTVISLPAATQARRNRATRYNPATVVTVAGTIEAVQEVSRSGGWGGLHLMLKAEKETLDVHLGPSSFVADKGFTFEKGDKIEVTGSKIKYNALRALGVAPGDRVATVCTNCLELIET